MIAVTEAYRMLWLVAAVIIAGYVISSALRHRAYVAGQIERERIRNSLEYRTQAAAIRDLLAHQREYYAEVWMWREAKLRLVGGQLSKPEREALEREVRTSKRTLDKMNSSFHAKYEDSPYNPNELPLSEWPVELR